MSFTTGGEGGGGKPLFSTQPFKTPASQPALTEMFRNLLRKSYQQQDAPPPINTRISSLVCNFDGAGQPLVVGMSGIPQIPPGAYRVIGCHLAAGIWDPIALSLRPAAVVAVSVDIRLASLGLWAAGSIPMYGATIPSLSNTAEATMDITDWAVVNLQPNDQVVFSLTACQGTISTLTATLSLREIQSTGIGVDPTIDNTGAEFTNTDGVPFEVRS